MNAKLSQIGRDDGWRLLRRSGVLGRDFQIFAVDIALEAEFARRVGLPK